MGKYDETSVINALKSKNGIKVNVTAKTVKVSKNALIGNSTYGKIDFLCNYCGYTKIITDEEVDLETSSPVENKKQSKRDAKAINNKRNSKLNR